jgi:hypothetical protein
VHLHLAVVWATSEEATAFLLPQRTSVSSLFSPPVEGLFFYFFSLKFLFFSVKATSTPALCVTVTG